ncbi:MAG: rRNA maturation RNase YbeY [Lachnospiraceae bacterium]|nr:rRNA maturation RNase YbeY [Lachnospiraceae bacterium]
MTINYSDEYNTEFDFDYNKIAELVVSETLKQEHFPYDVEIGISFVDEDSIRELNEQFRGIDKSTDVLSFPMIDFSDMDIGDDNICEMYGFIEDDESYFNPDNNEVLLGDIVLCIPKVISQAKEYNHSVLREYAFLIAHSMLHLIGYDHIDEGERVVMESKQDSILESLNLSRDC